MTHACPPGRCPVLDGADELHNARRERRSPEPWVTESCGYHGDPLTEDGSCPDCAREDAEEQMWRDREDDHGLG